MDLKHKYVQILTFLNDKYMNFTNYLISIVLFKVSLLWKFVFRSSNTTSIKLISLNADINHKMWKDPDKNTAAKCTMSASASQTNKSAAHKSQQVPDKMLVKKQKKKQVRKMSKIPCSLFFFFNILCSNSIFLFQIAFKLG